MSGDKKRPDFDRHKRPGFKLPGALVDHMKTQLIAQYGPRVLRGTLAAYDKGEISAADVIEGLRAALDVMDGTSELLTGEKGPTR